MSRPAFYPVTSPRAPMSASVHRKRLDRAIARGLSEDHPAAQAKVGRIHAARQSAVPQKGSSTPAAIAWHRQSATTPGLLNRRMRRFERERAVYEAQIKEAA